jgi:DNA recombination protein RmuC
MSTEIVILVCAVSAAFGAMLAWHLTKQKGEIKIAALQEKISQTAQESAQLSERCSRIPELQSQILELERTRDGFYGENISLREEIGKISAQNQNYVQSLVDLRNEYSAAIDQRDNVTAEKNTLSVNLAELSERFFAEKRQGEEKIALLNDAKASLTTQFENIANKILDENSRKFTEQNSRGIGEMLSPLRQKIEDFQTKVDTVYNNDTKDRAALGEQVRHLLTLNQSLSQDAKNLTSALKGSGKTQGTWGELVLDRVLDLSGLRKGEEYIVQGSYQGEIGSRSQPDVTIRLPEERNLIIDSKVSLTAYEKYASSDDDTDRSNALKAHVDSVRKHMKDLSGKNYQSIYELKTLDFVLMFVPIEPAFMLAVTNDGDILKDGWNQNVLLVSPSTLLFVLRTVSHLWRKEEQSRNAKEIAIRGARLYDALCGFASELQQVGVRIGQAQDSYNDAIDKLSKKKGNVIRQAEMLKHLGLKPTKSLPSSLTDSFQDAEYDPAQESGTAQEDLKKLDDATD